MEISARVVLDSVAPSGGRLTTFEVVFPRFILAEFNTHRLLSRNSASSRAVPVSKQCDKVEYDPFVPTRWGANQKGMQANEPLPYSKACQAIDVWLAARDLVCGATLKLSDLGVHKQHASRLIEPFMWHTAICSATHWTNFFALRDSPMAQPEFQELAAKMRAAYEGSTPREVLKGMWHLPLVTDIDEATLRIAGHSEEDLVKISAARCARVSYLTHDGRRDPQEDLGLYQRLFDAGHCSPLEHLAKSLDVDGWAAYSRKLFQRWRDDGVPVGNFWGWQQFRKTLENEDDFSRRVKS